MSRLPQLTHGINASIHYTLYIVNGIGFVWYIPSMHNICCAMVYILPLCFTLTQFQDSEHMLKINLCAVTVNCDLQQVVFSTMIPIIRRKKIFLSYKRHFPISKHPKVLFLGRGAPFICYFVYVFNVFASLRLCITQNWCF